MLNSGGQYYFRLQWTIWTRQLRAFGLAPWIGVVLGLLFFVVFTVLLFQKIDYAPYLYVVIGLGYTLRLSDKERNAFLQITFSQRMYARLRLLENILFITPFIIGLIWQQAFIISGICLLGAIALSKWRDRQWLSRSIPTPFSHRPFEFAIGFRKTFLFILLAFFLVWQAVRVGNFNLGAASIIILYILAWIHYSQPEPVYYVWIFRYSPVRFLWQKIGTALLYSSLWPSLLGGVLIFTFPSQWIIILGVSLYGMLVLVAFVLFKYMAFPDELSLPQVLLLALGVFFPPSLVVLLPYSYLRAQRQLYLTLPN